MIRESLGVATVCAILMVSAGRWNWTAGWVLTGIYGVWVAATAVLVMPLHPGLLAERATRRPERRWDKAILGAVAILTVAAYVVAGLDLRHGWSGIPPGPLPWAGGVIATSGYLLVTFSMRANPFFSTVSRIQAERGHSVATEGPYRVVRHPGYVGAAAFAAGAPLLLGSWIAFSLGAVSVVLLVIRTGLEDRMLRKELKGYAEYSANVRWRLVPGVW